MVDLAHMGIPGKRIPFSILLLSFLIVSIDAFDVQALCRFKISHLDIGIYQMFIGTHIIFYLQCPLKKIDSPPEIAGDFFGNTKMSQQGRIIHARLLSIRKGGPKIVDGLFRVSQLTRSFTPFMIECRHRFIIRIYGRILGCFGRK